MEFFSVSQLDMNNNNNIKGGGGCIAVKNATERDKVAIDNNKKNEKFKLVQAHWKIPFGLIHLDYSNNENDLNDRIIRLKRHSFENYLFDPIVLFSNYKDHLSSIIDESDIKNDFKDLLKEKKYLTYNILDNHEAN